MLACLGWWEFSSDGAEGTVDVQSRGKAKAFAGRKKKREQPGLGLETSCDRRFPVRGAPLARTLETARPEAVGGTGRGREPRSGLMNPDGWRNLSREPPPTGGASGITSAARGIL
jgi:hypothetical protein